MRLQSVSMAEQRAPHRNRLHSRHCRRSCSAHLQLASVTACDLELWQLLRCWSHSSRSNRRRRATKTMALAVTLGIHPIVAATWDTTMSDSLAVRSSSLYHSWRHYLFVGVDWHSASSSSSSVGALVEAQLEHRREDDCDQHQQKEEVKRSLEEAREKMNSSGRKEGASVVCGVRGWG